jgi:hypothetical protein
MWGRTVATSRKHHPRISLILNVRVFLLDNFLNVLLSVGYLLVKGYAKVFGIGWK